MSPPRTTPTSLDREAPAEPAEGTFDFSGGRLCLDFANTVDGARRGDSRDRLRSYADLLRWARLAGVLDQAVESHLLGLADARPKEAEEVFRRAIALREAIYSLVAASGRLDGVLAEELRTLNAELAAAGGHRRLEAAAGGCCWVWERDTDALDRPLWEVARSAAELLTSADLALVRECASDTCTWLFLDTTRNHSRKWCDMRDCGNRAKARRHYLRRRRQLSEPTAPG